MSRGVEVRSVSTIRSLFARSEEPVSVISTMASTNSWALTSVAPPENSTSAFTLWRRRYFFVKLTTSVAIRLPLKSLTDIGAVLLNPVVTGDAAIKIAVLDIAADLLRANQPDFQLVVVHIRDVGA